MKATKFTDAQKAFVIKQRDGLADKAADHEPDFE